MPSRRRRTNASSSSAAGFDGSSPVSVLSSWKRIATLRASARTASLEGAASSVEGRIVVVLHHVRHVSAASRATTASPPSPRWWASAPLATCGRPPAAGRGGVRRCSRTRQICTRRDPAAAGSSLPECAPARVGLHRTPGRRRAATSTRRRRSCMSSRGRRRAGCRRRASARALPRGRGAPPRC